MAGPVRRAAIGKREPTRAGPGTLEKTPGRGENDRDQGDRSGRTFHPVEGTSDDRAADVFARKDTYGAIYVAVLNYDPANSAFKTVEFDRLGLSPNVTYGVTDLWTQQTTSGVQGKLQIEIGPKCSKILMLSPQP